MGSQMNSKVRHRFDRAALYAALDAQRRAQGVSWQQVARETGVAASTIVATKRAGTMETDGMLAMVRWLGCVPEKFIRGTEPQSIARATSATAQFLDGHRFNTKMLYRTLDAQRQSRKMTWSAVAQEIGPGVLTTPTAHRRAVQRLGPHVAAVASAISPVPAAAANFNSAYYKVQLLTRLATARRSCRLSGSSNR